MKAQGQEGLDPNHLVLDEGYEIYLPERPEDPDFLEEFNKLSEKERVKFYKNRRYLIRYLAMGLTHKGVGHHLRWSKDKVFTTFRRGKSLTHKALSHAGVVTSSSESPPPSGLETEASEKLISFDKFPQNLSAKERAYLENSITAIVNNLWLNAASIAQGSGFGVSFVGGLIWNTHLGKKGFLLGRSLSIDIGVNFHNKEGYLKFYYDRESLERGGFALDIGLLMNVMVHLTDADLKRGDTIKAYHQKLPPMGSYRRGQKYNGWGAQFGIHAGDMVGLVLAGAGVPQGLMMVPAMRTLGFMTFYKSALSRRSLGQITLRKNHPLLWLIGIQEEVRPSKRGETDSALESKVQTCHQLFL